MTAFSYDYTDPDGTPERIFASLDHPRTAYLSNSEIHVPAHRLAEFTAALYQAAGQPAPDLPLIYDPTLVDEFAKDIAHLFDRTLTHEAIAHRFLAAGWRKP